MCDWLPNKITRVVDVFRDTSMKPIQVGTEDGLALVKYMGSRQGDIALVSELVGAGIAKIMGLNIPAYAIIHCPLISLDGLYKSTTPGPAFASKWYNDAITASTGTSLLNSIRDRNSVSTLVAFDTLVKNYDRFAEEGEENYDNLLFVPDGKKTKLLVIDHSHILLDDWQADFAIDVTNWPHEQTVYGYNSNFYPFMDHNTVKQALIALDKVDKESLAPIFESVPPEWGVTRDELETLADCIVLRAKLMQDWFEQSILDQGILDL